LRLEKKEIRTMCSDECRIEWGSRPENKIKLIESIKEGVLKKYGVEHVWQVKEIHEKTMINRDRPLSVERQKNTVREKHLVNLLKNLSDQKLMLMDEYTANKNGNTSLSYNFSCLTCGKNFQSTLLGCGRIPKCPKCFPNTKNNSLELFITDFLDKNNIK